MGNIFFRHSFQKKLLGSNNLEIIPTSRSFNPSFNGDSPVFMKDLIMRKSFEPGAVRPMTVPTNKATVNIFFQPGFQRAQFSFKVRFYNA